MIPRAAAYLYALLVAAGVGHFLLGIPIQLTDSFGNMLKLGVPWGELMVNEFTQKAYLRPFLWAELKLVYDASAGNYFAWFRGVHVAQVAVLALLYVHLVQPRNWRDAALVPLGLAALIGSHTFTGTIVEAFPINTFLTILLCCFAAAALSFATHRWWIDVLAGLLFVVAALTVESGLLVWVIIVGAALAGATGISRVGLGACTALLAGYFVLRFAILDVGSPGLIERASGFGFARLEPEELSSRFGDNPLPYYAYNVAASVMTVLFSEPRGGVFRLLYGISVNDPEPSAIVNVLASTCATILIAAYGWRRRRAWWTRDLDRDDRLVLLFLMVLAANAVISYPYTKDVIMSPAGAFLAVAVVASARGLVVAPAPRSWSTAGAAAVLCTILAATWGIRAVGAQLNLREAARKVRTEWAYVDDWLASQNIAITNSREQSLLRQLQRDAVYARPAPPRLPLAEHRWFDVE